MRLSDGARLFVDVDGLALVPDGATLRERPVVVAVHGGPGADHATLKPHLQPLTRLAQVIYVDLRGHGRSDHGEPARWNLTQWASDLAELLDTLGLEAPIVLGDSAGTYVALRFALDHPGRAKAFVLLSPSGRIRVDRSVAMFRHLGGDHAAGVAARFWATPDDDTRREYLRICRPLYGERSGVLDVADLRVISRPEVYAHFRAERATYDVLGELHRVTTPVLAVQGDRDPVTTLDDARDVVAALPPGAGRLVVLEGCGHSPLVDDPTHTLAAVVRFLVEVAGATLPRPRG